MPDRTKTFSTRNPEQERKIRAFYRSNAWRETSERFRAAHPICADPFNVHGLAVVKSEQVHHIRPLRLLGDLRVAGRNESNLQALCRECHQRLEKRGS